MSLHLEFVQRTEIGPALFNVKDVKLGRATSILHITLSQSGKDRVVGYLTNSDMTAATGLSMDTSWTMDPPVAPIDLRAVDAGHDLNWIPCPIMPFREFRPAAEQVNFILPRHGQPRECAVVDQWVRLINGQKFTDTSLGYVVDNFVQIIEVRTQDLDPYYHANGTPQATSWFPTLLLNLDIKKPLPEQGVEWLFVRVQTKQVKNGRYDLEVIVLDEAGDLVALSHHICMILSADRNTAGRSVTTRSSKL